MTETAAPVAPAAPVETPPAPITHQPFSAAALARALPKAKPGAVATEVPPETPAAAPVAPVAPAADPVADKLKAAQDAAAKIVERRKAKAATDTAAADRAAQLQADNARLAREAEEGRRLQQRLKDKPAEVVSEYGLTKLVGQVHIDESTPEGRIAKLEADLRARDERDRAAELQSQTAAQRADEQRREQHFAAHVQTVRESAEPDAPLRWGYVAARAKIAPALVVAEGRAAIRLHQEAVQRETGVPPERQKPPTNDDVYDFLEWSYAQADAARLGSVKPAAPAPSEPAQPAPVAKPAKAPGTPGLSTKGTGPAMAPKSYGQMTPKERRAHDVAAFKKVGVGRVGKDFDD
jgi:hypothetical protein